MNIGELARLANTKAETIRYYERIGLLPTPGRTPGNYRDYSAQDLNRLAFARRARDLGFSIEQVRTLLDLGANRDQSCASADAIAREHLGEVKRKIADLAALRRELESLISQCRHGTIAECRILEALKPNEEASRRARGRKSAARRVQST